MSILEKEYSDRKIINKWVSAIDAHHVLDLLLEKSGINRYSVKGYIGFIYIDHEAGISLKLHALCSIEGAKTPEIIIDFTETKTNLILRYDVLKKLELNILNDAQIISLSLPSDPEWLKFYGNSNSDKIRDRMDLDQFRAPGYFDDVTVTLLSENQDQKPEGVWVRLNEISMDDNIFRGQLLNEPYNDFGFHRGDNIDVIMVKKDDDIFLIAGNSVIHQLILEGHETVQKYSDLTIEEGSSNKATSISPEDADTWNEKGIELASLGKYQKALDAFNKALEIDPDSTFARYLKGIALGNLGRYQEALDAYDKVLSINQNNAQIWGYKGNALENLGRYGEALDAYNKALAIDPNDVVAWIGKGYELYNLGRYQEALDAYDEALAIDPNPEWNNVWNNKGDGLIKLGRYQDALDAYDEALAIDPGDAMAWNDKGNALEHLDSYQEAMDAYDKALAIDPDNAAAQSNKENLLKKTL